DDPSVLGGGKKLAGGEEAGGEGRPPLDRGPEGVTRNRRAFRVLVRNALFRRVELAALRRWDLLAELYREAGWDAERWREALEPYFAEHADIGTGADARGPQFLTIIE